ncbi:MAG: reverse transcriptase family protein [Bacteroidota bacterium]
MSYAENLDKDFEKELAAIKANFVNNNHKVLRPSLKIVSLNARSIKNKIEKFEVEVLDHFDHPHLICITETWLESTLPDSILRCDDRYKIFREDRNEFGGGVAILVRKDISCCRVESALFSNLEMVVVKIRCFPSDIMLSCIYRPHATDVHLIKPIFNALDYVSRLGLPMLVAGDFNAPDINWQIPSAPTHLNQDEFLQTFIELSLTQLVRNPTRGENILDLFFTDEPDLVINCTVNDKFSDHSVVSCEIDASLNPPPPINKVKYDWSNADYLGILHILESTNWYEFFDGSANDIDCMWNRFSKLCNELFETFVPKKTVLKHNKRHVSYPKNIKRLLFKKRAAFRKAKINPVLKPNYKRLAKKCESEIRKHHFEKETQMLLNPSSKKFFSYVKSKLYPSSRDGCDLMKDGVLCSDPKVCASIFSDQYCSVFVNDDGKNIDLYADAPAGHIDGSDVIVTPDMVFKCKKLLNGSGAPGPDGIPPSFYKKFASQLAVPLQIIFSESFNSGTLPQQWKTATITPVYKGKGSKTAASSYRPISLTSVACKLMERVMKNLISDFLLENNILSKHQHGFLSSKSTETQLLECVNDWTKHIDAKIGIDVFYLDISKAFDTVSHPKLCKKLEFYGIRGKFLSWIYDFLKGRTQRVKVDGILACESGVVSGVPQGSVLGPLLFLLYINDIVGVCKNSNVKLFADDSKVYFKCKDHSDYVRLHSDVESVLKWMDANQLSVAVEKCSVLHVGGSAVNPSRSYQVNGIDIPPVNQIKDLGVKISSDLKFSSHCTELATKAFQRSNLFFKCFRCRDPSFLTAAFKTYIRPILEYSSTVWNPYLQKDIALIESVQRRFTKRIPGFSRNSYYEHLDFSNLDTLELRRLRADLCMCYKIVCKGLLDFNEFFQLPNNRYNLRCHSKKLFHCQYNLDCRKFFFSNSVVDAWNYLPEDVVSAIDLASFKSKLSKCDLSAFLKYHQ